MQERVRLVLILTKKRLQLYTNRPKITIFLLIEFDVRLYNKVKNATQKWLRKQMELSKICYSDVRCRK